jgi:DNA adenine methylase
MTTEFAKRSGGIASDAHPALMALYAALRQGWVPPVSVTEEEHRDARHLPDTDPLKGFVGFGASYGGKWFGGYARGVERREQRSTYGNVRNYAAEAARSLAGHMSNTAHWHFECCSFLDHLPGPMPGLIYCDPPYADTTEYSILFDSTAFWRRAHEWAQFVPVYVSEFSCPVSAELVLEIPRNRMSGSGGSGDQCVDRLFKVLP